MKAMAMTTFLAGGINPEIEGMPPAMETSLWCDPPPDARSNATRGMAIGMASSMMTSCYGSGSRHELIHISMYNCLKICEAPHILMEGLMFSQEA